MHPAPSEGEGGREGGREARSPATQLQGQQCLGSRDLLPCPEKLGMLTAAQSYLEEPPKDPEEKGIQWTLPWVSAASETHCVY